MGYSMKDDAVGTQALLAGRLARWQSLAEGYANPEYADAYVLFDVSERVVLRIDQPRVVNLPKLRYESPDPFKKNWTVLTAQSAAAAISALNAQAPAFAPHRSLHVRELVREQSLAASQGLELLMTMEAPVLGDAVSALFFKG